VDDILIRAGQASSSVKGPEATLAFRVDPAAPSPFSGTTTVRFQLPSRQRVALRVFDAAGRLVRTIADDMLDGGAHSLSWDGRTEAGTPAPSGIYYATLRAGDREARSKLVLAR
jgi:flagellar hook assembly protein FlgD